MTAAFPRSSERRTLRDRVLAWRDRLLASPAFMRWAVAFPVTRPVARRRARALFDIGAGFVYSQTLAACVRLDLFRHLAEGPRTAGDLATAVSLPLPGMERLLRAAASLDLVEPRGPDRAGTPRYGLGALGGALLADAGIAAMVRHHAMFYDDLRDPVALLRGERSETALSRYWAYARTGEPGAVAGQDVAAYSELMASSQALIAQSVLDAYPFGQHRRLLDVGGGNGTFVEAVAKRHVDLGLGMFDLPAVAEHARSRLAEGGLDQRITVSGGDFFTDSLPSDADVITLVRIIHDHDDDKALALLRAARKALTPGGTLILAEPMAGTAGAEPVGGAYFELYLLAMGSGRPRTPKELETLLKAAGFRQLRHLPTAMPMLARLLVARV